ncbi:BAG family molecular chaperone regulator 5, mitochondrial-like [Quercus suber]|uniref:BAG family molecular chaperone regulator 5, mitochondrial-like n=1 Tax=Quercus suber TaxID=58331 RepID=UPI0032E01354
MRMNEALMGLLLKLDYVLGVNPMVREARRKVSCRIVALQEILDAVSKAKTVYDDDCYEYGFVRSWDDANLKRHALRPNKHKLCRSSWDDVVAKMEEEVCRERGGDEMERFRAEHLGFRCLQRFLSGP